MCANYEAIMMTISFMTTTGKRRRSVPASDPVIKRKKLEVAGSNHAEEDSSSEEHRSNTLPVSSDLWRDDDPMEQEPDRVESQDVPKTIEERMEQLFSWFNAEKSADQFLALAELSRGCRHAKRSKYSYENTDNEDRVKVRQQIQKQSILFRYLTLSPNCAEIMRIWETQFKEHNKRMCARIMEVLAEILQANYFLSTRKTSTAIARVVVKDKLRWIYAGFSGAFSQGGL